jgi:hypothetical protein
MGKGKTENELGPSYVYVPEGAKLNLENTKAEPPKTKYDERQSNVEEKVVKKLCGGRYGKNND